MMLVYHKGGRSDFTILCLPYDGLLTNDDFELGPDGKYDKSRPRVPVLTNQIPGNVKYVDIDGNGEINSDDMVPYGSNDPDLTYGFTNRFSYKNLELSVFLRGQIGGKVLYLAGRSLDTGRGNYNGLKDGYTLIRRVRRRKSDTDKSGSRHVLMVRLHYLTDLATTLLLIRTVKCT